MNSREWETAESERKCVNKWLPCTVLNFMYWD